MKKTYKQTEYSQKLRDPRWQKKRLEIMQRDEFHCNICGDGEITLHVHHLYYNKGKEPWDYENSSLVTVCENCHALETESQQYLREDFPRALASKGMRAGDIHDVVIAMASRDYNYPSEVLSSIICHVFDNQECWQMIEDHFWDYTKKRVNKLRGEK